MATAVEIVGLEPRRSDLARGIVIARARRPLDGETQRAFWQAMEAVGATEIGDDDDGGDDDDDADIVARQWLAAPWLPPAASEIDAHRAAVVELAERYELEGVWFVKIETGIDGVAWRELVAASQPVGDDDDDETRPADPPGDVVDAIFDEQAEVLYAAPDAPLESAVTGEDDRTTTTRTIPKPPRTRRTAVRRRATGATARRRRRPRCRSRSSTTRRSSTDYDANRFGVALKLAGDQLPGEESIVNAFFALWLSVYQDERVEELEPFERADVVHDRAHRSALMWVEKLAVPATASDQVHFLMWLVARLHEVIPIAWARFEDIDAAVKRRATADDEQPLVLAGNPLADRYDRHGEDAALQWAAGQSAWSNASWRACSSSSRCATTPTIRPPPRSASACCAARSSCRPTATRRCS